MRDPLDLPGQEADEAEQAEKAKVLRQQQVDDIKWLMGHTPGRRFVTRLLEETGLRRTSFHTSGSLMALNEGRKQLGYFLEGELLEITPEGYLKLLMEYQRNE
jgi:hypothetical protein